PGRTLFPYTTLFRSVGNPHARRPAPGDLREQPADLGEREVRVAENVLLADPAALGREQMAARDVAHVNQVEPGVERREHLALERSEEHTSELQSRFD